MAAPNFFVIGASKCGTTSLCAHLGGHPDVFFSDPKEPRYFTHADELGWTAERYAALFAAGESHSAIGEGSTTYAAVSLYPGVERRIAEWSPDARIIYIVRHPLERMESQWLQRRSTGTTNLPFDRAIRELREMIETNLFWQTATAYRETFGEQRMLVLFLEDFKLAPLPTLRRCFEFLGVDPDYRPRAPEQPLNPREGLRADGPLLRTLRALPGSATVAGALARSGWAQRLKRQLTHPLQLTPRWDPASLEWASQRLIEDNRRFLLHYGKPEELWSYGEAWLNR